MLLALWLWLAPPVESLDPPAQVRWQAHQDGCPSAEQFERRVAEVRGEAQLSASFEFVVVGEGPFELRVVDGERFEASSCEALADTALLLVALALAPESGQASPVPREVDAGGEADDVAPFLRGIERREFVPYFAVTPARVLVEVGLTLATTPRPALDLFVGAGPRGKRWAVDLGMIARPSFAGVSRIPEVGARMWTVGGLARACVGGRAWRFALAGCGGLELAAMSARATGPVVDSNPGVRPWAVVEAGPELSVPLSKRAALVVRIVGTWAALRPRFSIAGAGEVCCTQALGIAGRVGMEFGLGR